MKAKLVRILSSLISASLIGAALFIAFIILFPVDVLQDWTIRVSKADYSLGDNLTIEGSYTKTTGASGTASRYIECQNANGIFTRYLISQSLSDRPAGVRTSTGTPTSIPETAPAGVTLPTTCYFSVSVAYDVYPRRAKPEYARTNSFTLHDRAERPSKSAPTKKATGSSSREPRQETLQDQTAAALPTEQASPQVQADVRSVRRSGGQSNSSAGSPSRPGTQPAQNPMEPAPEPSRSTLRTVVNGTVEGVKNVVSAVGGVLGRR